MNALYVSLLYVWVNVYSMGVFKLEIKSESLNSKIKSKSLNCNKSENLEIKKNKFITPKL